MHSICKSETGFVKLSKSAEKYILDSLGVSRNKRLPTTKASIIDASDH